MTDSVPPADLPSKARTAAAIPSRAISAALITAAGSEVPQRYAKQARFAGIGPEGQRKLAAKRVLIVGCGATGGVLADTLARAGVGMLRIADRDLVEFSNLQRQVLFDQADAEASAPKAIAAAARLSAVNRDIIIEPHVADVRSDNVLTLADGCDLILDGSDNFEVRYLLNDVSHETGIPWIYSGVIGSFGQTMAVFPGRTACLRCVIDAPPEPGTAETCDTAGVIGPAVNVVASYAAATAMKILTGQAELVPPQLTMIDVWSGDWRTLDTSGLFAGGGCATCRGARDWLWGANKPSAAVLCGQNAVQVSPGERLHLDLPRLADRLAETGTARATPYFVKASVPRESGEQADWSFTIFRDGRVIVHGTDDLAVARSAIAQWIGM